MDKWEASNHVCNADIVGDGAVMVVADDDDGDAEQKLCPLLVWGQWISSRPAGPLDFPRPAGAGEGTEHHTSITDYWRRGGN